jgi:hypothetical protein
MDVEFTVSLVELKRAFRRLSARVPDEAEAGGEFVVFDAYGDNLKIAARGTTEGSSVSVGRSGKASLPSSVFDGIARTLRFYRGKAVRFGFATGSLTIKRGSRF